MNFTNYIIPKKIRNTKNNKHREEIFKVFLVNSNQCYCQQNKKNTNLFHLKKSTTIKQLQNHY